MMENGKYSTPSIYPCDIDCSETPSLCIFYALASLLVVVLAVTLLWYPILQLISEVNTIIARVMIYFNNQFLGIKHSTFFECLEASVNSPKLVIAMSVICMSYILYQASGDFLISLACYIKAMPDNQYSHYIKQLFLNVIMKLLDLKGGTAPDNRLPTRHIEV